ncbi:MAG: energy transducer TonB [Shinella sp.]|nr:MAG: energy transducer TonB [Shinella sp.]
MTGPGGYRSRFSAGELLLWSSAAVLVASAHAGAVAFLMRSTPEPVGDPAPPAAIMIEMADVPEAANTEEEQIVNDQVDAEDVKSESVIPEPILEPPPVPEPEPTPEPVEEVVEELPPPEPEPLPEPVEEPPPEVVEEIDPIEQQVLAQLENVAVPIPVVRPPEPRKVEEQPKKKPEKKVERKKPTPQPPASQAARQAKLDTTKSDRTAARQTSSGGNNSMSPAKWMDRVRAHIVRRAKTVPVKQSTVVNLYFTFDGSGNVLSVSAKSASGDAALEAAAIAIVRRSSPLPPPVDNVANHLSVAVKFDAR